MKAELSVSSAYRQNHFIETGQEYPAKVVVEIPFQELSPESRRIIVSVNPLLEAQLTLPSPIQKGYWLETWPVPFVPSSPSEWEELLKLYQTAKENFLKATRESQKKKVNEKIAQLKQLLNDGPNSQSKTISIPNELEGIEGYEEAIALQQAIASQIEQNIAERDREKAQWIQQHGSSYLKNCAKYGYDCQRRYVYERAALEYPDYFIDFDDTAAFAQRTQPSAEALEEAIRVGGLVCWLTKVPKLKDAFKVFEGKAPCEAVVIRGYLDKYDLIREM